MRDKKIVEISAPHYGLVEDVNIYCTNTAIIERITSDVEKKSFVYKAKAEISGFELVEEPDDLILKIRSSKKCYNVGVAFVEVTYGGLAYNTFQDLYALNNSLKGELTLRPIIGLPSNLIQELKTRGMCQESKYFLSAKVRKSLMMIHGNCQLNLVSREAKLYDKVKELPAPDVAIISTYPRDMNTQEIDKVIQYKGQNPNLKVYFNPGGTQVKVGIEGFRRVIPLITLVTMKLDEAGMFLGIDDRYKNRDKFAMECITRFLRVGVKICVLNDSKNGSYIGCDNKKYLFHIPPFPRKPIEEIVKKKRGRVFENFSGCGDGIFSVMLYTSESYPKMALEERLAFANSIARLISLLPESNLYGVDGKVIRNTFEISKVQKNLSKNNRLQPPARDQG
jgi:hypothetical protein